MKDIGQAEGMLTLLSLLAQSPVKVESFPELDQKPGLAHMFRTFVLCALVVRDARQILA